ncbi:unnamed protein product [Prunus armeniaca]|uniref:Uncharacterized protein n=1 Tax=Prunus armeniaca TaxID=36596 RepID=A0A6J5WEU7_PRUAR|nr:unnamed protein product [Prunus armeniaca]
MKLGRPADILHLDAHPDIYNAFEVSSQLSKIRIFVHEAEWLMNTIQTYTDSPVLCG